MKNLVKRFRCFFLELMEDEDPEILQYRPSKQSRTRLAEMEEELI